MRKFLLLIKILGLSSIMYAQVGINTEAPYKYSELDIKNLVDSKGDIIPKGILIPRMSKDDRDKINLTDDNEKELANSLLIYNTTEGCYNYYLKEDKEWKSLCGKVGKSNFTINDCAVATFGEYKNGEPTGPSHYLKVSVTVDKIGTYAISATTTDPAKDNGYFFFTSGEFLSKGTFEIIVPAMGTPKNYTTPNKDEFTIELNGSKSNGSEPACIFEIEVENSAIKPKYVMQCGATQVVGQYYEEVGLNSEGLEGKHYIELMLAVDASSDGATYEIKTNEVDGISFYGSGRLVPGNQVVRLQGKGVPYSTHTKKMYITTNSESSTATCTANVYIIIPPKRILTIGSNRVWGYNPGTVGTAFNKMITDLDNFGPHPTSIVRYSGFINKGTGATSNEGADDGRQIISRNWDYFDTPTKDQEFHDLLFGTTNTKPVDILFIGWTGGGGIPPAEWDNITDNQVNDIANYLHKGGIVIIFNESPVLCRKIFRRVFNKPDVGFAYNITTNPAGSIYRFPNISDPILNGPFGNLMGLTWGEDASYTNWATELPLEDLVLYSNNVNRVTNNAEIMNSATAFRHISLPLVWVGDGGFTSNDAGTASTICPFKIGAKTINGKTYSNYPFYKKGYGHAAYGAQVYNAVFTANAFAWCIQQAEENRRAQMGL